MIQKSDTFEMIEIQDTFIEKVTLRTIYDRACESRAYGHIKFSHFETFITHNLLCC